MFCWNCGQKNPEENNFCGGCGRRLLRHENPELAGSGPTLVARVPDSSRDTLRLVNPLVEEPHTVRESPVLNPMDVHPLGADQGKTPPAASTVSPTTQPPATPRGTGVSGPSFLGLSDDANDSDYLLEDEEAERSGWRGYAAIAILAIVALLVYRQWTAVKHVASELVERAEKTQQPAATPPPAPAVTASIPRPSEPITPESDAATAPAAQPVPQPAESKASKPAKTMEPGAANTPASEPESRAVEPAPNKPAATGRRAVTTDPSVVEAAQRYLQGRGVAQDCARGIGLLRGAARKQDPRAQIQLGALYATGHCVTQDRAAAYYWLSQAQQLEPRNSYVNRSLSSLWAGMTSAERKRAEER